MGTSGDRPKGGTMSIRQKKARESIRMQTTRPVEITIEGIHYHGVITNESNGGLLIKMSGRFSTGRKFLSKKNRFSIGQKIEVDYLSPQGIGVNRKCEIVRLSSEGFGVKFKHLGYAR